MHHSNSPKEKKEASNRPKVSKSKEKLNKLQKNLTLVTINSDTSETVSRGRTPAKDDPQGFNADKKIRELK